MSTFSPPSAVAANTLIRSATFNDFLTACTNAFAALPSETSLTDLIEVVENAGAGYSLSLMTTSSTSLTMATGNHTLTVEADLSYIAGVDVVVAYAANTAVRMVGTVVSYSGTTLVVNIETIQGSGTYDSWTVRPTATVAFKTIIGQSLLGDGNIDGPTLLGYLTVAKGNSGTTTQTYDYEDGLIQTSTATGDHTIAFSDWPVSGKLGEMLIVGTNFGAHTITWPTIQWLRPRGGTTTSISTYLFDLRRVLQTTGTDQFFFWTFDGGTTVYGVIL